MKKPLSITVISDPHYYSKKNWVDGNPFDYPPKNEQLYLRGSEEIIKAVFDEIAADESQQIVLISGDLTNNGEITSHDEMRSLLLKLKESGTRIYVTTATHDYSKDGKSYGFDKNNNMVDVPAPAREKLYDYYREFGMDEALSVHMPSMSYVAQLADGYRLLALNDDYGDPHCGYSDECFEWIKEQVELAHRENQYIVAMTHHPILAASKFFQLIAPNDMLDKHELRYRQFADMGINCVFTGHSHIHNISSAETEKGNIFYDVSTAALTGFPPAYRKALFYPDERKIEIKTVFVDNVPDLDTENMSLTEYTKKLFLGSISDALYYAQHDYEKFVSFAIGMSVSPEKSYKLKPIIRTLSRFLNNLTFGKVWHLTRFSNGVKKEKVQQIFNKPAVPFIIDIVSNLYKGDANLDKSSPEYKIAESVVKTADKLAKPFSKKLRDIGIESFCDIVLPLMHKDGIGDANAELYY